jgi:hypothetical protein
MAPNDIYVNREQSEKTRDPGTLTQTGIDRAFRNNQRRSKLVYTYGMDIKITILNGKNSKQLEVTETKAPSAEIVRATSVERSCELSLRPSIERSTHSRNSGATWRRPRWQG